MGINWHDRFTEQSRWTKSLRDYLLQKIKLDTKSLILEVGSGTGAILSDINYENSCSGYGIDINFSHCATAIRIAPKSSVVNSDVYDIPYSSNTFDLIYCHYFLLWLKHPQKALQEIRRTLKPGGAFVVFAEPDYFSRIDHPPELIKLGELQTASLIEQGVNPTIGRELPSLAADAGFENILYGVSGFETSAGELPAWWESEWDMLEADLGNELLPDDLINYKKSDHENWLNGHRVLWVPTFYLSCTKPVSHNKFKSFFT